MKLPGEIFRLNLWALVDGLQRRFEERGLSPDEADQAVKTCLESILRRTVMA